MNFRNTCLCRGGDPVEQEQERKRKVKKKSEKRTAEFADSLIVVIEQDGTFFVHSRRVCLLFCRALIGRNRFHRKKEKKKSNKKKILPFFFLLLLEPLSDMSKATSTCSSLIYHLSSSIALSCCSSCIRLCSDGCDVYRLSMIDVFCWEGVWSKMMLLLWWCCEQSEKMI